MLFRSLLDTNNKENPLLYVARDPYGVRPLYIMETNIVDHYRKYQAIGFASELKCLHNFFNGGKGYRIQHFTPGTYSLFNFINGDWYHTYNKKYIIPTFSYKIYAIH